MRLYSHKKSAAPTIQIASRLSKLLSAQDKGLTSYVDIKNRMSMGEVLSTIHNKKTKRIYI